MGATFGLIHIRNVDRETVLVAMKKRLAAEGCKQVSQEQAKGNLFARRIAVWSDGTWVSILDEALEARPDLLATLGESLSTELKRFTVCLSCYDSDQAWLTAFDAGADVGQLALPEDAKEDPDGRRRIGVEWLKAYAASEAFAKVLSAGIRGDHVLADEPLAQIGEALGLQYACGHPDEDDLPALYFLPARKTPPAKRTTGVSFNFGMPDAQIVAYSGEPLEYKVLVQQSGEAEGASAELILSGPGLDLIKITAASLSTTPTAQRVPLRLIFAQHDEMRFELDHVELPSAPDLSDIDPAGDVYLNPKNFADAFCEGGLLRLNGEGLRKGEDVLNISFGLKGKPASAAQLQLIVKTSGKLYEPLLPSKCHYDPTSSALERDRYTGTRFIVGWLAWDAEWSLLDAFVLRSANQLARALLSAAGAPGLKVSLTSAGSSNSGPAFRPSDDLLESRWSKGQKVLAREGLLDLSCEVSSWPDQTNCSVMVAHQPFGVTKNFPEDREEYRIVGQCAPRPIMLAWSMPSGVPGEFPDFMEYLDDLMQEAAGYPTCVGGYIANAGMVWSGQLAVPYESLSGIGESTLSTWDDAGWLREHVRTPGWRVIVPKAAAAKLAPSGDGVELLDCACGKLLRVASPSPWEIIWAQRRAAEACLLPALPPSSEWDEFFRSRRY